MAIKDYKNIEKINQELESTAQIIKPTDLNIFKTSAKNVSDFGLSKNDVIEFRLYDTSNNLLEQTGGKKVKYIYKDDLSKYLKDSLDTTTGEKIFEIDIEKLVIEAGYNNGEFRTAFNFVKNYVGNDNSKKRVWIHEISPSRSEIRVLPLLGVDREINNQTGRRYTAFIENSSEYRKAKGKIIASLDSIEIQISDIIDNYFISKFGNKYVDVINKDFSFGGPAGYNSFKKKVYTNFRQSVIHQLDGKSFQLGSTDYGQGVGTPMDLDEFALQSEVNTLIVNRLNDSIEYNSQFINKKQYTSKEMDLAGEYKPSANLESLLNTGYNSVTKLETSMVTTNLGGNSTNKVIETKTTTNPVLKVDEPTKTPNPSAGVNMPAKQDDPFTAGDDTKQKFNGVLPDVTPNANKVNTTPVSVSVINYSHDLKNYSFGANASSKTVTYMVDGLKGIVEVVLAAGEGRTVCGKKGTFNAPQGYVSISPTENRCG